MRGVPGVMWRDGDRVEYAGRAPNFMAMDDTPIPEFDEYFYARVEGGYESWADACEQKKTRSCASRSDTPSSPLASDAYCSSTREAARLT